MAGLSDIQLPEVPEGTPLGDLIPGLIGPGSPLEVGDVTVDGVTYAGFLQQPPTMGHAYMLLAQHGDAEAVVYQDERYSYSELLSRTYSLSHRLVHDFGVTKGTPVAIAMRNFPEYIAAYLAITAIGGVAVLVNAWWGTEEMDYAIKDSGARLVFTDEARTKVLSPLMDVYGLTLIEARGPVRDNSNIHALSPLFKGESQSGFPTVDVQPDDDLHMMYTSGSTGFPKGAICTHRAGVTVLMTWAVLALALKMSRKIPDDEKTAALVAIPFFHITGLMPVMLVSLVLGRKLVIMYRWDVEEACKLIETERVTGFSGVPTMGYELSVWPGRKDYDLSSLKDIGGGGAARPVEHVAMLRDNLNVKPGLGYGLTETNALGCVITDDEYIARPNSTGKATSPMVDIKIVDPATLEDMPQGERGEIWIKTIANARAYWNRPEESADAFRDGWFRTGDVGYLDADGYVFIVDRIKDIIIRGGENISTLEVEGVLHALDGVDNVLVLGLSCPVMGERVGAVIHRSSPDITEDSVRAGALAHLAKFKVPEVMFFTDAPFPTIASGKVDKKTMKDSYRRMWDDMQTHQGA